jgi:MYXO-CTERM domain-containing protein
MPRGCSCPGDPYQGTPPLLLLLLLLVLLLVVLVTVLSLHAAVVKRVGGC